MGRDRSGEGGRGSVVDCRRLARRASVVAFLFQRLWCRLDGREGRSSLELSDPSP